ncbi:MAG: ankyrin repeat domain-containing protein [bacterium]|nr:ankyrin repeat domain-containing protein [bacterium]
MKKVILFLFLTGIVTLHGYPYEFRRLIQQENGKITKVVDLISDVHVLIAHPTLANEEDDNFLQENLLSDERDVFDSASRRLLATLRYMGKKASDPKKLLIEAYTLKETTPAEIELVRKEYLTGRFLRYIRYQYLMEFSPEKKQEIVAESIDTIRKHPGIYSFIVCLYFGKCGPDNKATIGELVTPLFNELLKNPRSVAELCLNQAQECPLIYSKLQKMWELQKQKIMDYKTKYFEQTLQENPSMLVTDFIKTVRSYHFTYDSHTLLDLIDFESMVKILSSKEKHVIVYAGGAHCTRVAHYLKKDFNFKPFVHVGLAVTLFAPVDYSFPLSERAWVFLEEQPQQSIARGPTKKVLYYSSLNELFTALKNPHQKNIESKILRLLNQGASAYVDIANVQEIETGNTPYHYALAKRYLLFNVILKLIKLKANKYIKNNEGKTPSYYVSTLP